MTLIGAAVLAALGALLLIAGVVALFRFKPISAIVRTTGGVLLLSAGVLLAVLALGVYGFRALTHEVIAARIDIEPISPQRFRARFHFPDGTTALHELAGDEIYVDALILKWTTWANLLGLHTSYSLDRVAGRYRDLAQERRAQRTVVALAPERRVDLLALRRRFSQLAPLYDAEYGSASFVPADQARSIELRVSTTGLLIRDAAAK
jgi:hypothetical protein